MPDFSKISIDVPKLFKEFPLIKKSNHHGKTILYNDPFHLIYQNPLIPLRLRNYFWYYCRRTNLDLSWFDNFKYYWSNVLGGRPLWGVQDFYFLRSLFRLNFDQIKISKNAKPTAHLKTWQKPKILYFLFQQVYKESLFNRLEIINLLKKFSTRNNKIVLEFGCGTAPITTTLFEFFKPSSKMEIYLADIQTLSFHYAAYKFKNIPQVKPILLKPENNFLFSLKKSFDSIFCTEVFEHLNEPFETIKIFHNILHKNGLLFFDYIKGDSEGLNTIQGVKERNIVLDFISKNFDLLYGNIKKDKNVSLSIVRKI